MKLLNKQPELFRVQAKYIHWLNCLPEDHKRLRFLLPNREEKKRFAIWKKRIEAYQARLCVGETKNGKLQLVEPEGAAYFLKCWLPVVIFRSQIPYLYSANYA